VLVHQALLARLNDTEVLSTDEAEEVKLRAEMRDLVLFFSEVVDRPQLFQLRSKDDVKRIVRTARAALKGPAQPASGRNKRKARQERRMRTAKSRRKTRRVDAESYNEAQRIQTAELEEAQTAWEEAVTKQAERFETLAAKDTLTSEETQEILEMFGASEAAVRLRTARAANDPQARIEAAAAKATAETDPED